MEKKTTGALYLDVPDPQAAGEDQIPGDDGIRFFGPRSFGASTWAVSLFVALDVVVFLVTMLINNCPAHHGDHCVLRSIGRLSFQPPRENPLLGPSASTLKLMGALRRDSAVHHNEEWRILTCIWLHAGVIHLAMNLFGVILVGIRMEQDYGPLRIGTIYLLSAFFGSSVSTIFIQHAPAVAVASSGALSGLLGALLSGLIYNWNIYDDKYVVMWVLALIGATNFLIGLLPHVDNFANVGGFVAGALLGCVLLFNPQLGQMERKKGLYDYDIKRTMKLKQKFDKPRRRIIAFVIFLTIFAGAVIAVLLKADGNKHCSWCHYIDCVPTKMWKCKGKGHHLKRH